MEEPARGVRLVGPLVVREADVAVDAEHGALRVAAELRRHAREPVVDLAHELAQRAEHLLIVRLAVLDEPRALIVSLERAQVLQCGGPEPGEAGQCSSATGGVRRHRRRAAPARSSEPRARSSELPARNSSGPRARNNSGPWAPSSGRRPTCPSSGWPAPPSSGSPRAARTGRPTARRSCRRAERSNAPVARLTTGSAACLIRASREA